ncbi:hypothetical protein ACFE04_020148 [Oxalis oulophora]
MLIVTDEHENSLKKQCTAKTSTSASKKAETKHKSKERISERLKVLQELVPNGSKEKDTDKIFYGLDDIEGGNEIIIVEGEMDKLSMEEASRIILAIDGDAAGQALAEELARRLGKERCWRVKWPKKNDDEHCKDANETNLCNQHLLRGVEWATRSRNK